MTLVVCYVGGLPSACLYGLFRELEVFLGSTGLELQTAPRLFVGELEHEQQEAVQKWAQSQGWSHVAPVGCEDDLLETILGNSGALASSADLLRGAEQELTVSVVVVGENQARAARELVCRAAEQNVQVALLPEGVDLHREAITFDLWRLYELTQRLRRECPWDRKQTQETLIAYTLEETYELVDTVRARAQGGTTDEAVRSELGDLLYQVYFLACLAEEQGLYDLGQVAEGIYRKLVRRHPHIFGGSEAPTAEDVKRTWDIIKRESEGREGIFHDVPSAFPATLLAQKVQQRAAAVGFDWDETGEVLAKLKEEIDEMEAELSEAGSPARVAAEMGDVLFSVVNLARKLKVDSELSLRSAALRFRQRVEEAARLAESHGYVFEQLTLDEQESYYQSAKEGLKQ